MKIYEYQNYDEYVKAQKDTTNHKFGRHVYVRDHTVSEIYHEFKNDNIKSILCHGTRSGEEQKLFKKAFNCYVIGSELCEKAILTEMTKIWDFNKRNEEWVNRFDIVYTNSFDHCFAPVNTLKVWKDQLKTTGRLLIDWCESQNGMGVIASDPLNASQKELIEMASQAGLYLERKLLDGKSNHGSSNLWSSHGGIVLVFMKK